MARGQGAALDRKKLMADPIMVTTIVVLITFLTLVILYPLAILLVDSWANQEAIDAHHASPMMATIASLREKYDLHMTVERYNRADTPESETRFIRK